MADIKNGGPAFPDPQEEWRGHKGMTLRDYMAGQWLAGYIASPTAIDMPMEEAANAAYDMADAMLRAREANHG